MLGIAGIAGLALLLIGWIPETASNWRQGGKNLSLRFVLLYLFGSALLAWHALRLGDPIFLALNSASALIALFNACIILSSKNGADKRKNKPRKKRLGAKKAGRA